MKRGENSSSIPDSKILKNDSEILRNVNGGVVKEVKLCGKVLEGTYNILMEYGIEPLDEDELFNFILLMSWISLQNSKTKFSGSDLNDGTEGE